MNEGKKEKKKKNGDESQPYIYFIPTQHNIKLF